MKSFLNCYCFLLSDWVKVKRWRHTDCRNDSPPEALCAFRQLTWWDLWWISRRLWRIQCLSEIKQTLNDFGSHPALYPWTCHIWWCSTESIINQCGCCHCLCQSFHTRDLATEMNPKHTRAVRKNLFRGVNFIARTMCRESGETICNLDIETRYRSVTRSQNDQAVTKAALPLDALCLLCSWAQYPVALCAPSPSPLTLPAMFIREMWAVVRVRLSAVGTHSSGLWLTRCHGNLSTLGQKCFYPGHYAQSLDKPSECKTDIPQQCIGFNFLRHSQRHSYKWTLRILTSLRRQGKKYVDKAIFCFLWV